MTNHWIRNLQRLASTIWRRPIIRWFLVIVLSLLLHLGLFMSFQGQASQRTIVKRFHKIKFRLLKPRPRPKRIKPKPRPKPKKKKKRKKKKRKKKKRKKKKRKKKKRKKKKRKKKPLPRPNQPPPRRPPPRDVVPQPVFGLNMNSLSKGKGKAGFRRGNTLEIDPSKNPPKRVVPYAQIHRRKPPPRRSRSFQPVPLFDIDENPQELYKVNAAFPPDANRDGVTAVVILSIQIWRSGRVRRVRVISIRPPQARRYGFAKAAVKAIRQYRFKPAKAKGKAVDVTIRYTYKFELDD